MHLLLKEVSTRFIGIKSVFPLELLIKLLVDIGFDDIYAIKIEPGTKIL